MKRMVLVAVPWSILVAAGAVWGAAPAATLEVDRQLQAAWQAHGITPASEVDDARYLRRLTLDLTGRLPQPEQIIEFLNESSSGKRERAVERLLASSEYAEHWATYWDNVLMGRLTREGYLDRAGFREWLRSQFAGNAPWDKIVVELLTAEGYNTNRRPLKGGDADPKDFDARYSPASNWFLRYSRSLPDLSSATSRVFLGVQIQCAQCHDHKSEKWKQKDFQQFTACFAKTWATYVDRPGMLTQMVGTFRMETKDRWMTPPVEKYEQFFGSYKDYVSLTPKLLDGPELGNWGSRRDKLAKWVVAKENPYFAKAIVNRLWGKLLGRGFVDPVDDFRPGNPPLIAEPLDTLAADFVAHGYDLRHLLRAIVQTQAYQRACVAGASAAAGPNYWSSFPVKALEVEELFDALTDATGAKSALDKGTKGNFGLIRNAFIQQLVSQSSTDDMPEVTEPEETIPRSLMLINGALVNGATRLTAGYRLSEALGNGASDSQVIERLYLQTVSRRPTADEQKQWQAFVERKRSVVHTPGPASETPTGLAALRVSPEIQNAGEDADFSELLKHAKTSADFTALRGKMKNNADAALYVKAFQAFAAEAPFAHLASSGGGNTAREQAFEDLFWALLNCTEYLTNH